MKLQPKRKAQMHYTGIQTFSIDMKAIWGLSICDAIQSNFWTWGPLKIAKLSKIMYYWEISIKHYSPTGQGRKNGAPAPTQLILLGFHLLSVTNRNVNVLFVQLNS